MFTAPFSPDHRQRNSGDPQCDSVCAFSPASRRGALDILYGYGCSLWLDPSGIPLDHCCGAHACNVQLDCLSFRHVLTSGRVQHTVFDSETTRPLAEKAQQLGAARLRDVHRVPQLYPPPEKASEFDEASEADPGDMRCGAQSPWPPAAPPARPVQPRLKRSEGDFPSQTQKRQKPGTTPATLKRKFHTPITRASYESTGYSADVYGQGRQLHR